MQHTKALCTKADENHTIAEGMLKRGGIGPVNAPKDLFCFDTTLPRRAKVVTRLASIFNGDNSVKVAQSVSSSLRLESRGLSRRANLEQQSEM